MSSGRERVSGEHLTRRSDLMRNRQRLPSLTSVLVIDDTSSDADRIRATLSVIFGYDLKVRHATTIKLAVNNISEEMPDIIFLDDYLKPADNALETIPLLRHAGYQGDIVVVSGQLDHHRHRRLMAAGAADAIHKDDLNSVRIGETLDKVLARLSTGTADPANSDLFEKKDGDTA